jgi:hypothetical protein
MVMESYTLTCERSCVLSIFVNHILQIRMGVLNYFILSVAEYTISLIPYASTST